MDNHALPPRGITYSISDAVRMRAFCTLNGKDAPSFILDATGVLVHRDPEIGCKDSLIPYAVAGWMPSNQALAIFVDHLVEITASPLAPSGRQDLYKRGLTVVNELYAPDDKTPKDLSIINQAIGLFDRETARMRNSLEAELNNEGVFRFNSFPVASSRYCDIASIVFSQAKPLAPGWFTSRQVIRRVKYG